MAVTLLGVQSMGWLTVPLLIAITFTLTMGSGMASPAALARALSVIPELTGSAAGLYGFKRHLAPPDGNGLDRVGPLIIQRIVITVLGGGKAFVTQVCL